MSQTGFGHYRPGSEDASKASGKDSGAVTDTSDETAHEPTEAILADDAELDLSQDGAAARVEETLTNLETELIGLGPVKRRVREIASLLLVDRARRQFGLASSPPTLHMSCTGGPSTPKTTVALRIA